jgi:hypothetical protein
MDGHGLRIRLAIWVAIYGAYLPHTLNLEPLYIHTAWISEQCLDCLPAINHGSTIDLNYR